MADWTLKKIAAWIFAIVALLLFVGWLFGPSTGILWKLQDKVKSVLGDTLYNYIIKEDTYAKTTPTTAEMEKKFGNLSLVFNDTKGKSDCFMSHEIQNWLSDNFKVVLQRGENNQLHIKLVNQEGQTVKMQTIDGVVPCIVMGNAWTDKGDQAPVTAAQVFGSNYLKTNEIPNTAHLIPYNIIDYIEIRPNKLFFWGREWDTDTSMMYKPDENHMCFFPQGDGGLTPESLNTIKEAVKNSAELFYDCKISKEYYPSVNKVDSLFNSLDVYIDKNCFIPLDLGLTDNKLKFYYSSDGRKVDMFSKDGKSMKIWNIDNFKPCIFVPDKTGSDPESKIPGYTAQSFSKLEITNSSIVSGSGAQIDPAEYLYKLEEGTYCFIPKLSSYSPLCNNKYSNVGQVPDGYRGD